MYPLRGFTLFDLLLGITLISITLGLTVAPLRQSLSQAGVNAQTRELLRVINLGRQSAVQGGSRVVICSVDATGACQSRWGDIVSVFSDSDADNRVGAADRVIRRWQRNPGDIALRWRGFGPGYLRFQASGTAVENGAFTLCPANGDPHQARQVVVNRVGRSYRSRDRDGDGVVEYGDDQEPDCT